MVRSQLWVVCPGRGQILCNYSTPPPHHASMDTYTIQKWEGEGEPCQPAPTPWIPPHTTQLQRDLPTPLTHNNTQQHTTALHNSTRVHKTTNVPVVFMALILNGFEGCIVITRGIGRGGLWKSQLFWAQMALASLVPFHVAPLKTITYGAIKTTGTLIVISHHVLQYTVLVLVSAWGKKSAFLFKFYSLTKILQPCGSSPINK